MDEYSQWNSFNCLFSWIRLIRYLNHMSPSTQQLTQTLSEAMGDLSVSVLMLCIVFIGFAQAFILQFGQQVLLAA